MYTVGAALIYALIDPRNGATRYIGKSTSGMRRPREHAYYARHGSPQYCERWVRQLQSLGLVYEIVVLEEVGGMDRLGMREKWWIAFARAWGCSLTNLTDGGGGMSGYVPTMEARARIGAANRVHGIGRKQSAETVARRVAKLRVHTCSAAMREKIRQANKGRTLTAEHRAKLSAAASNRTPEVRARMGLAQRGKRLTPEHRAKIAVAGVGRRPTPETRKKLSAWQRGVAKSIEHRAKIAISLSGKRASIETRAKLSAIRRGHKVSDETRAKLSATLCGRVVPPEQRDRSWVMRRAVACLKSWGCAL